MKEPSLRILFVSSAWPLGTAFGGQMRALQTARALQAIGDVTILVASSEASNEAAAAETRKEFRVLPAVHPQLSSARGIARKLRRHLDPCCLDVHGVVASVVDRARVLSYFPDYDLIWVLNSRTANILQIWNWPRAHLDIDDVPSTYLRTVAENGPSTLGRLKAGIQQRLLKRREMRLRERFTTLSVCSRADRAYLGDHNRIHVIPNGFQRPEAEPVRNLNPRILRIGFIGLYSYPPNHDGVRWFLRECWPSLRRSVPGIRLRVVGKETDGPLRPTEPDVDALGWVSDPSAEMATWSAMIVPIRFGGGTRIKIAEAFSRKCPAVSTRLGAFGYEVEHKHQVLLVDEPAAFADACRELIQNPAMGEKLAAQAWRDFLEKWTWDAISPKVIASAEDCLRHNRGFVRHATVASPS